MKKNGAGERKRHKLNERMYEEREAQRREKNSEQLSEINQVNKFL